MLISFTGDVTRVSTSYGTPSYYIIDLTDRTTALTATIQCKGPLEDVAKMVKSGQVMETAGWLTKSSGSKLFIVPFVLRAKSGVNEADINRLTAAFTENMVKGEDPTIMARLKGAEAEMARLKSDLVVVQTDKESLAAANRTLKNDVEPLNEEIQRLRATAEQLERDLIYERTLKGVMSD